VADLAALLDHQPLVAELERARALGLLGPGPVRAHIEHTTGFLVALEGVRGTVIDLGSGGGVPGLIVGVARPDLALVLLDARATRCRFLEGAARRLALDATVVEGSAEVVGRGPYRGTADAVVARSFGPPPVTAECAAPLLRPGGVLVVSEPPDADGARWPAARLAELGLEVGPRTPHSPIVQVLYQTTDCPPAFPRRDGLPAKRPLF
jgi:16S rRNA (guanine527-N7)-methyltransferase